MAGLPVHHHRASQRRAAGGVLPSLRTLLERLSRLDDGAQEREDIDMILGPRQWPPSLGSNNNNPGADAGDGSSSAGTNSSSTAHDPHQHGSSTAHSLLLPSPATTRRRTVEATAASSSLQRQGATTTTSSSSSSSTTTATTVMATQSIREAGGDEGLLPPPLPPLGSLLSGGGEPREPRGAAAQPIGDDSDPEGLEDMDGGDRFQLGNLENWDMQATATWLAQQGIFVVMLLLVFLINNHQGILFAVWLVLTCYRADEMIKKQVALKDECATLALLAAAGYLLIHAMFAGFILYALEEVRSLALVLFIPPERPSMGHALYLATIADNMIRLAGMFLKVIVLMIHSNSPGKAFRQRGHVLTLLEYIMLTWRWAAPCGVWYQYFLGCGFGAIGSSLIAGIYLSIKLNSLAERLLLTSQALRQSLAREAIYGEYATQEEVLEAGMACAICQETMSTPLRLSCRHVFCEDCVSEWFEREPTCPLCRAVIKPAGLRSFSNGCTSMWPQLF